MLDDIFNFIFSLCVLSWSSSSSNTEQRLVGKPFFFLTLLYYVASQKDNYHKTAATCVPRTTILTPISFSCYLSKSAVCLSKSWNQILMLSKLYSDHISIIIPWDCYTNIHFFQYEMHLVFIFKNYFFIWSLKIKH